MLGLVLCNVVISGTDKEIRGTLSKIANDTGLSGAVDTPKKRQNAIHRDLDQLK